MQRVTQEEPWAKIPHWVVMHPDLDASAIRIYAVLSKHANRARHSFPGLRKLAEEACMSRTTVIKALVQLEAAGAVIVKRERFKGRHRVNLYHLPLNRGPIIEPSDVSITEPPGSKVAPPSGSGIGPEQDLKNQLTRSFEIEAPKIPVRLPGESRAAHAKRIAGAI